MHIRPHEIAFDIDGVFADTFRTFHTKAVEIFGLEIEYDDLDEYFFWRAFDRKDGDVERILEEILHEPLKMGIQPLPGAVEVLTRLSEHGVLRFITARKEPAPILKWMRVVMPNVSVDSIHVVATGDSVDKLPVLKEHRVKYFVEDRLDTCFLIHDTPTIPIVFDQPWNRKPHPFHVVNGWRDIDSLIVWG